ncbi:prepilin-type N-terminal cleavage/methylation domain-containing protein [Aestuariibacter sp. AA17]|uniref:Prepilin-type N-terminal cleavage/methylation domain-containing protein n=1 Tax=Fluctibacter corallii TaxID=2984329 RepID=A0ABT3A3V7_9ALTE|nr:prepilin-type N-terminal cleavage/methylation domain-containing protein [Aestuariibacter sp. AA17]MCV2883292.1 prepilin-type N-terminal cleavage/methylation domain-containing protein [Aestuariibacter sp. AA17]
MRSNGFTLVEMLITVAILMMVMLTGSYAYKLFSSSWERQSQRDNMVQNQALEIRRIHQVLSGIVSLGFYSDDISGLYLEGQQERLISVTRNGLFHDDEPVIFELFVDRTSQNAELVYREVRFSASPLFAEQKSIEFENVHRFQLSLDAVAFSYYGWESLLAKNGLDSTASRSPQKQWFNAYNSVRSQLLPELMLLHIQTPEGEVNINVALPIETEKLLDTYDSVF